MNKEDLYPNLYRVTFEQMEGDNYAGGLVTRVVFLEDVMQLKRYKGKIKEVVPIVAEYLPPLNDEGVEKLFNVIAMQEEIQEKERIKQKIQKAEEELERLKGQL